MKVRLKVSNEVKAIKSELRGINSNKCICYTHYQMRCYSKNPFSTFQSPQHVPALPYPRGNMEKKSIGLDSQNLITFIFTCTLCDNNLAFCASKVS